MDGLALALVLVVLAGASMAAIEWREARLNRWQSVRLRFGRDVSSEAVVALVDRLASLPARNSVALDVVADPGGIAHYLRTDQATLDTLRAALRALLPSLRLEPIDNSSEQVVYRYGRLVRLRGRLGVLRTDQAETTSAALLTAMQPLGKGERLVLRWLIQPSRPAPVPRLQDGQLVEPEDRRRLRLKNEGGVVRARAVVAVATSHPKRAAHLLGRLYGVLRSRGTAYGRLQAIGVSGRALMWLLSRQRSFFADRYAASELAGLLAWPIDAPVLSGLTLGTSPVFMPSERLPRSGRVLGTATWPGAERVVAQPVKGALSHSLITGPTGVGKSTLLANLIGSDIADGRGVLLIDGKGDTANAVLSRIKEDRRDDVIVLDCASPGPQPGFKAFSGAEPELAADVVLGVFSDLFRDSWGPLSERYLRAGLIAVAHDSGGTLADLPYVFSDPAYRRKLTGRVRDPLTKATFAAFEAMSAGERQQQLAAPLNKLGTLLSRPIVRTVLGQPDPQLDFGRMLAARQIVVVSLAPARIGAPAARLIGALTVFGLFQAVQGRALLPERARTPFLVYVDEPKSLGELPMPLDALLEQARGLGVGITLAPQSISQLPKAVREAALTNAATRVVFRQHADDARLLARDLPGIAPEQLGDLAAFEAVARIGLGPGDVAPLVSFKTAPLPRPLSDAGALRAASARRFGRDLASVDAALEARHQQAAKSAPVGRTRRAS